MAHPTKIVTIVGARPQFIKAAVVSRAIEKVNMTSDGVMLAETILHTGQHYDHNMSQVFFEQLGIPKPAMNLGIGSGSHGAMTGRMLACIEEQLQQRKPEWVMVYGDTNSTLAGALAAAKLNIPVIHVEAGLRSFNRRMPEEINRVLTDHIASLLFCPSRTAVRNLSDEGVVNGVINSGDVMYDAYRNYQSTASKQSNVLTQHDLQPQSYFLCTLHRQENTDIPENLKGILQALKTSGSGNCPLVFPIHPRTRAAAEKAGIDLNGSTTFRPIEPVSYLDMVMLESHAKVILTDSGGVQKEAYFAKVPCITLRNETEWTETVEAGWNRLAGADTHTILNALEDTLGHPPRGHGDLYGAGDAGERIVQSILEESQKAEFQ